MALKQNASIMAKFIIAICLSLIFVPLGLASDCTETSIGETPLNDLPTQLYRGYTGGLYPNEQNELPPAHLALGLARAAEITPINGKIVLLSIGVSNTSTEFQRFQQLAAAYPDKNPALVMVNGAQGSKPLPRWLTVWIVKTGRRGTRTTLTQVYQEIDKRLVAAGVTRSQVQAVWFKLPDRLANQPFPDAWLTHAEQTRKVLRNLKMLYPNVKLVFLTSRIYGGYSTNSNHVEPDAYQHGFAYKWVIESQIDGTGNLNADPALGPVIAPWVGWGPYLWADGLIPRSDGLTWACSDFRSDGVHPAPSGADKIATRLLDFFKTSPLTTWFN